MSPDMADEDWIKHWLLGRDERLKVGNHERDDTIKENIIFIVITRAGENNWLDMQKTLDLVPVIR